MRRLIPALLLAAATPANAGLPVPAGVEPKDLTLERLFASPALSGASPRGVKLSPDGKLLSATMNDE